MSDDSPAVSGILLAAGYGRRFGSDKRWHRLADGTPMALAAGARLLAACPHSIAVVRPEDDELAAAFRQLGLDVVHCADARLGMGHTLAAGVAARRDAAGWLVALADMPDIAPASYRAVLAALAAGAGIARPQYAGRPGHPVGFAATHRAALLALSGDEGGRSILAAQRDALQRCPVDDPGILLDLDENPAGG